MMYIQHISYLTNSKGWSIQDFNTQWRNYIRLNHKIPNNNNLLAILINIINLMYKLIDMFLPNRKACLCNIGHHSNILKSDILHHNNKAKKWGRFDYNMILNSQE